MAKRKKTAGGAASIPVVEDPAPKKQSRIPGSYDPVPKPVQEAADSYVEAKRETAAWREQMNGRRDHLIARMREHGVAELDIDDGEKKLLLVEEDKVKIKAKKQPKGDGEGGDEE